MGFSLKEIKNLLILKNTPDTTCSNIQSLAKQKLADITGKIKALRKIEIELKTLIKKCTGGNDTLESCSIINTLGKKKIK